MKSGFHCNVKKRGKTMEETKILQLSNDIENSICDVLNKHNMCPPQITCKECLKFVLNTLNIKQYDKE
jgi:hypothetical protein